MLSERLGSKFGDIDIHHQRECARDCRINISNDATPGASVSAHVEMQERDRKGAISGKMSVDGVERVAGI